MHLPKAIVADSESGRRFPSTRTVLTVVLACTITACGFCLGLYCAHRAFHSGLSAVVEEELPEALLRICSSATAAPWGAVANDSLTRDARGETRFSGQECQRQSDWERKHGGSPDGCHYCGSGSLKVPDVFHMAGHTAKLWKCCQAHDQCFLKDENGRCYLSDKDCNKEFNKCLGRKCAALPWYLEPFCYTQIAWYMWGVAVAYEACQ